MLEFLESLPFVLPCKFCRSSLITYYEDLPPEDALDSKEQLSKWMWKIHGKVNEKLRSQGQHIPPDPTYAMVKKIYMEMKRKNPAVKLGAAMKEASRRKSEM